MSHHQGRKTGSGERRGKSRNSHRIPILELLAVVTLGESGSVLVKLLSTPKREICRLMLRVLSSSTGSESLRPRHVFYSIGFSQSSILFVIILRM